MAKKKKQKPTSKKSKKKQQKRKKNRDVDHGPASSGAAEEYSSGGLMGGMRSGMTNVAKGQSRWLDIFLWVLVILALFALAYRMGWLTDPAKTPAPQTQRVQQRAPGRALQPRLPGPLRTGVQPPRAPARAPVIRRGVAPIPQPIRRAVPQRPTLPLRPAPRPTKAIPAPVQPARTKPAAPAPRR